MSAWLAWRAVFRSSASERRARLLAYEGPTLESVARLGTLAEAWGRVRANKGGPGADGVTIGDIAPDIERQLERLSRSLLEERYRPGRLRHAVIAKPAGGKRRLRIPPVLDRVAQTAALISLEPDLDRRMSETSCAYRCGRGVDDAIAAVEHGYARGLQWTLDADIASYFETIPHRRLTAELAIWIDDTRLLRLLSLWLRSFSWRGRGLAQGAPISPLLANIYLHPVDRLLAVRGHYMVRYADDFVVLCASARQARQAREDVDCTLRGRGLALNPDKTSIAPPGARVTFLGRQIGCDRFGQNAVARGLRQCAAGAP